MLVRLAMWVLNGTGVKRGIGIKAYYVVEAVRACLAHHLSSGAIRNKVEGPES